MEKLIFQSEQYVLYARETALVYQLREPHTEIPLTWPVLEIDGENVTAAPDDL